VTTTVLVAYATKHGSTRDVAEAIAERISTYGIATYVRPAGEVTSLDGYHGVVLGSAIYMGRLHADARRFLRRHRRCLAVRPFAVFAMGPRTLADEDVTRSHNQLGAALATDATPRPCTTAVFGGVFDPAQHRFPFNRMPASDARDWNAIRAWADDVTIRFLGLEAVA
jgi:menaquinone-dependent protoporphyrinogen oxidase